MNINKLINRHRGQKWGSYEYEVHLHLVRDIAALIFDRKSYVDFEGAMREDVLNIALLHDLLEDTDSFPEEIDEKIRPSVVLLSRNLSQREGMSYKDYIRFLVESGDEKAMIVKLSDALANRYLSQVNGSSMVSRYEFSSSLLWKSIFHEEMGEGAEEIVQKAIAGCLNH